MNLQLGFCFFSLSLFCLSFSSSLIFYSVTVRLTKLLLLMKIWAWGMCMCARFAWLGFWFVILLEFHLADGNSHLWNKNNRTNKWPNGQNINVLLRRENQPKFLQNVRIIVKNDGMGWIENGKKEREGHKNYNTVGIRKWNNHQIININYYPNIARDFA